MNIVHVTAYFEPQLGYQEYYLAKMQQKLGHNVAIVTSDRHYPWTGVWREGRVLGPGTSIEEGLKVYRLPCRMEFGSYLLAGSMRKTLAELRPDIVHAHEVQSVMSAQPALYKREMGFAYLLDCHTFLYHLLYKNLQGRILYLTLKRTLLQHAVGKTDRVVAIMPASRRWFAREFLTPEAEIDLVPLGVDVSLFRPDAETRAEKRRQLSVGEGDLVLLHVGRLYPEDRIEDLIIATSKMTERERVKILLVGAGASEYANRLRDLSQRVGVPLILHGRAHRREMWELYNCADIAVWLSRHPMSILEAVACGTPVIIPRVWGRGNLFVDDVQERGWLLYDNGLVFDEGNVSELTQLLDFMASHPDRRLKMGKNGRKLAEDHLDWRIIAEKWLEKYKATLRLHA